MFDKNPKSYTDLLGKTNRIVEGTVIEGEIRCESNIRIDGVFTGNIGTKGRLVIGPTGKIDGNVICQNAEIEGFVKGKLNVQQLLSLQKPPTRAFLLFLLAFLLE